MARTFFYIKNMNEKTIKAICTEGMNQETFVMYILAKDGIHPHNFYTNGGMVKSYWVNWVAKPTCYGNNEPHMNHLVPMDKGYIYLEKTNKKYHFNNPREFEEMRNDIEALCALAMLED